MIEKIYNPKKIEQPIYENWEKQGYFKPNMNLNKKSFCISIPPPNITGDLHMGHAFQQTIMDILIRYHRMQGKNTLWQVGIDHAGIATQIIVENKIFIEEGKTRYDYSRKEFIQKIWTWANKCNKRISYQMRRLGYSLDWERKRFTMDENMSVAVKEAFIRLYNDGFIYRGMRLVNWDVKLRTVISDLEVNNRESNGIIWYLRYQLSDNLQTNNGLNYLIVATTRPETIFGDVAIAINPKDFRFNTLIGKHAILPLTGRRLLIISDEHVEISKGTGCMKVTPAHDFNDYEISKRHNLFMINILTNDGYIRNKSEIFDFDGRVKNIEFVDIPIEYQGLDRFVARDKVIEQLKKLFLLEKTETCNHTVPYSERSGSIIEPMLTKQWFINVKKLTKNAIDVIEKGNINFIPKQYKNEYFSWMNETKDWCISRQLWWGHRIPVWYDSNKKIYVGYNESDIRQKYKLNKNLVLYQDEDVLDTWFSSGLWTFSSLGWPNNTKELRIFHPNNVIISGFDIIFFWIARMIMLTAYLIKDADNLSQIPFKTVYITGLIRDEKGKKMSKSKGNVIDPLDIIDGISIENLLKKRTSDFIQLKLIQKIHQNTKKQFPNGIKSYGADSLRFTLTALSSKSRNIKLDMNRLEGYHKFCNKLWNASRFVIMHSMTQEYKFFDKNVNELLPEKWILAKFNQTVKIFRDALDNYRFDIASEILYEFIWNQFCDWYVEISKLVLINNNKKQSGNTCNILVKILEKFLRLAHPVIPFITEFIWQKIKLFSGRIGNTIMLQTFPCFRENSNDNYVLKTFEKIKKIVSALRIIRIDINASNQILSEVFLRNIPEEIFYDLNDNLKNIASLSKLPKVSVFLQKDKEKKFSIIKEIDGIEILIPLK